MTTKGFKMIELQRDYLGFHKPLYPTIVWDETNAILFDTPHANQYQALSASLEKEGLSIDRLTMVSDHPS